MHVLADLGDHPVEAWLDALLAGLAENRALLTDLLARHLPSVRWTPPEAT